jgi:hypothetical protein
LKIEKFDELAAKYVELENEYSKLKKAYDQKSFILNDRCTYSPFPPSFNGSGGSGIA